MTKLINALIFIFNFLKLYFIYPVKKFRQKEYKELEKNNSLKNSCINESCFILGNGPSLANENLELLENQKIFTVNQIARNKNFNILDPVCHFWVDPNFFRLNLEKEEDMELLKMMKLIPEKKEKALCFYPIYYKELIEKMGLSNEKVRYLAPELRVEESMKFPVDLSRYTPNFGTVVQHAIYTAIFMGFKKIYLLGCDSTGIMSTINALLHDENNTYSYDVSKNEKRRMETMVENSSITAYAYSYYMMLEGFEILNKYCIENGIELVNLSSSSVLDMLPRDTLENIIKKERQY